MIYCIIIELDIRHKNDFKKSLKCSLGEFPTIMYLGTKNQTTKFEYRLAGVVEYIPGHYIAYSFRNGGFWQKYNDMDHKISISHSRTRIEPHVAIYIRANKINNFNNENSDVINSI